MIKNDEATKQTRREGWRKGWTDEAIKKVWDSKIKNKVWLHSTNYRLITDACHGYKSVIDIGCGGGMQWAAFKTAKLNVAYTGVDIHPEMVNYARQHFKETKKRKFVEGDATDLLYKDDEFDVAIIRLVIEHYKPDYALLILQEAFRIAKYRIIILFGSVPRDDVPEPALFKMDGWADLNVYNTYWLSNRLAELAGGVCHLERKQIPKEKFENSEQELWIIDKI